VHVQWPNATQPCLLPLARAILEQGPGGQPLGSGRPVQAYSASIPSTRLSLQWERHRPWHMRVAIAPCLYLEVMPAMACLKGNMQSPNTQSTMGFRLDPVYARNCVSLHELVPACQHATLVSTPPRSGCHPSQRCQPVPDNDPHGLPPRLSTQCQEHEANELALIVSLLAPAGTRP
jgi:hypothetical protein